MKKKVNQIPLVVAVALILFSHLIGSSGPPPPDLSANELFQHGLVDMCSGIFGLTGWFILIVAGVRMVWIRKRAQTECTVCGAEIPDTTDHFCSSCGSQLRPS